MRPKPDSRHKINTRSAEFQVPGRIFFTVTEIAGFLGFSRSRCAKLVSEGCIPSYRLGRSILVRVDQLEGFLDHIPLNIPDTDVGLSEGVEYDD